VETYTMDMLNSYAYSASMYGMTLEDLAAMYQMTMDEFEAEVQMMAEQQIKVEILYQYIAEKEAMEVTEDEYMAIVQAYMEYYGYTDMTSFVNDYGVENVEKQGHADALLEKVMQFCYDNAVKTDAPLETEAPETTAPAVG
jgi:FKBP-type peptidyl-prolyl cis-trans isomerase (trigger factor)